MGKVIGIFCAGQFGDTATISSVLKYKKELWGEDAKIVWYIAKENMDLLKYQDIEIREFPRGFGYPEMVLEENKKLVAGGKEPIWADWLPLVDEENHLRTYLTEIFPSLIEIDIGYFPAPHQISVVNRHGIEYPNVSKKVFGVPMDWEWHPVLKFSDEERTMAIDFMDNMEHQKTVCIESFCGSGQSKITGIQIIDAMDMCKRELGRCNFIFMSHKFINGDENFPEGLMNNVDVFSASDFTVRQCALIVGMSHLLISVSSGISVAASCWENKDKPFKTLQYCGSEVCSTKELYHNRHFELVTHDGKRLSDAVKEFNFALAKILKEI